MIRTVHESIRSPLCRLKEQLNKCLSATTRNRPLSSATWRAEILDAAELVHDVEIAILDAILGVPDDEGEVWHLDDEIVLGPAAENYR